MPDGRRWPGCAARTKWLALPKASADVMRFFALIFLLCGLASGSRADLPVETPGRVETLPVPYPGHWFWAHDSAFDHFLDGRMILVNGDGRNLREQRKGMVNAAFMAEFIEAGQRQELYVAESYFERGHRGQRTDLVTVYDKATLSPIAEILLLGAKRANMIPGKFLFTLIGDEQMLLVYNFTPATSVTVIDVAGRKVLNEVPLPGCALLYPTGPRGFSSLCGDASMITVQLDANGQVTGRAVISPFFDIQKDALFENPGIIGGVAYFPTFAGNVREIDLRGDQAQLGSLWSLLDPAETKENWRPGGMNLTGVDAAGRFYILMHRDGREGSHKDDGQEVWVFDVKQQKRVQRIVLKNPGFTVELTRDADPLLLVVNREMNVDVYTAGKGEYLRTLKDFGQESPLLLHAVR